MSISRNHAPKALLLALEADAASARSGFACLFSTADEYEAALITARRAQGRYHRRNPWPAVAFVGCALAIVGAVLLLAG